MKLTLRRARPSDALKIRNTHVASIRGLCSRDYTAKQIEAWSGGKKPGEYRNAMKAGERFFVARVGERIVGFSSTIRGEIRAVYVHPRYVRRGIAGRLLRAAERCAFREGFALLRLSASMTALPFYKSSGYKKLRDSAHTLQGGTRIRCALMAKRLP